MEQSRERENFCRNIAYLRRINGLTQKQMAQIMGIGVAGIAKLEKGILPPRLSCDILYKISDHFSIPIYLLFSPLFEGNGIVKHPHLP